MNATVVRARRQTTLPADVCEAAGIGIDDQVDWRFEGGEIRGRKLKPEMPVEIGLDDVPGDGILPQGWELKASDIATAIREEREISR